MPSVGYCTLEDLRRAMQEASLPGDISQDKQIAVDSITAQTEWLEKTLKRHWYAPAGADILDEATDIDIPTGPKSRDDEQDIPTPSAIVVDDDGPAPKTWQGSYTKLDLARRDAGAVTKLLVRDGDGSYTDWVASDDYSVGQSPDGLGDDAYVRVNNGGWSALYLDVSNLYDDTADEWKLDTFSNAVYAFFEYGYEGLPQTIRRAVAFRAASDFVDEAAVQIPENARVRSVESLADQFERKSEELLEVYR
ncbi:hypothetical protein [Haloarcula argentinensis]|uniref:Uncharacterized protein n=1 Tax=Haloarcula argentinensis TaxID=43776 RepID=A0ABU2F6B6_HALAR|nr:hypothetical protein [Haloarcula argentinensis]EMA19016.1 hypothetical protein C443_17938 [Haloarcula argentinensis DSM 12282]MDS0256036.1 hypothetical protein [Haloarcula argentinensis]